MAKVDVVRSMVKEEGTQMTTEAFAEGLYKSVVEDNMRLYRKFFSSDPNEDGTIEYWRRAMALYGRLDEKDREVLLSIVRGTIVDSVSTVLAILDGVEDISGIDVQVALNGEKNDGELQDAFLAYVEEWEAEGLKSAEDLEAAWKS